MAWTKQQLIDFWNTYININGINSVTGENLNTGGVEIINAMATESGIEVITEGSNTGYALKDDNRSQKGDIGQGTVDLNKDAVHTAAYIDKLTYSRGQNMEPLVASPAYDEGNVWYDNNKKTIAYHNDVNGVELNMGETWLRVINKSGGVIPNGAVVRNTGADAATSLPTIVLAFADTFTDAFIIGVATHEIADEAIGYVTTNGEVGDVQGIDTSHLNEGEAVYLSDKTAGEMVSTAPTIATVVGMCIKNSVADGKVFVNPQNLLNFPGSLGILQQLTDSSIQFLASAEQVLVNWIYSGDITMVLDPISGTIQVPDVTGFYRVSFSCHLIFISESQTRWFSIELYNLTLGESVFEYAYNIPRDSTSTSFSFNYPFSDTTNNRYVIRAKTENTEIINFNKISFDITSLHLRQ